MLMFFTKKVIVALSLATSTAGVAAVSTSVLYKNYVEEKTPSTEQFDFDVNDIADTDIVLDGYKDEAYSDTPSLEFGPSSCVQLYTYHGKGALYMFFDVTDAKVNKRAIGNNNAQDEDGVEISVDRLIDGGTVAQKDDLRIFLGVSGYHKVIKGNGNGWDTSNIIGFGGSFKSTIKEGTTVNENTDTDTGYCLEYRIPYISLFGDANETTPIAMAFVHSGLEEVSGSRTRTGMSGHAIFKIPTVDNPNNYIVLAGNDTFYTKKEYFSMNETLPTILGKVVNKNGEPVVGASVEGYYSSLSARKFYAITNSSGYFNFDNMQASDNFIVKISRAGMLTATITYTSENLKYANGAEYNQNIVLLPATAATRKISGKISALATDNLKDFKVEVFGYPTLNTKTDESGNYTIDVYEDCDNLLLISKKKFETTKVNVAKNDDSIKEVEIYHEVTNLAKPSIVELSTNKAIISLAKARDAIYVKLLTYYEIDNNEELLIYFNTGDESYFYSNYSNGDYRLSVGKDTATISKYDTSLGQFVVKDDKSSLIKRSTHLDLLYQTDILIPYDCIDADIDEVFGVAATYYDGKNYQESTADKTIAKDGDIDFTSTATYLRFASDGSVYFANNNLDDTFLYYYHAVDGASDEAIPENADRIYVDYKRNETGLKFDIAVDNGFGNHFNPKYLSGYEAINLVLNLDGINQKSWALFDGTHDCYDLNLRIYGDDSICYINSSDVAGQPANQLWWSDQKHNNGTAKNFTLQSRLLSQDCYEIENKPGYKVYHLDLSYAYLKSISGAPENVELTISSPISMGLFELSETSRTTVRFYTNSGDSWIYKNHVLQKKTITYSGQNTFYTLEVRE